MKFFIITSCIIFFSCNSTPLAEKESQVIPIKEVTETPKETIVIPDLPADYKSHDLKKFKIDADILAPEKAFIYSGEVINNEGKRPYINVQLLDTSTKCYLQITLSNLDFSVAKKEIHDDLYRTIKEIIQTDSNSVFYSYRSLDNNKEHLFYGFLMVANINGKTFHLRPPTNGYHITTKDEILNLYAMAKSIKAH